MADEMKMVKITVLEAHGKSKVQPVSVNGVTYEFDTDVEKEVPQFVLEALSNSGVTYEVSGDGEDASKTVEVAEHSAGADFGDNEQSAAPNPDIKDAPTMVADVNQGTELPVTETKPKTRKG